MNQGFGRELDFQDIYDHVTSPDEVYLLRNEQAIESMASYNRRVFSGKTALIVEGVVVSPRIQGKGVFGNITEKVKDSEDFICLRTQNPRMYRALEKICDKTYPNLISQRFPSETLRSDLANHFDCEVGHNGVARGFYGSLFYGLEPIHPDYTDFFKKHLGMHLEDGDALLVVGTIKK